MERDTAEKERSKPLPVAKDNDALQDVYKLHIGEAAKNRLMDLLKSDVQFLQDAGLNDYGLVIGVHECDAPFNAEDKTMDETMASAGDGLGSLESKWRLAPEWRRLSLLEASAGLRVNDAEEDEYEEEEAATTNPGTATPPDSSPGEEGVAPATEENELHPTFEFYGIRSAPDSPRKRVYFVGLTGLLSRSFSSRKRPGQSLRTSSKHAPSSGNAGGGEVCADAKLFDFLAQCVD